MTNSFFSSLSEQLNLGASRASLGMFSFRNHSLREHLRTLFQQSPGIDHSFLADPVFEATFGWKTAEKTFGELSGNILHSSLVEALSKGGKDIPDDYIFPTSLYPYRHQMECWQALAVKPPRSVIVSSGTGSGKTECFLIPILNDLASECDTVDGPLVGVRALFLYPLNALIKSQKDRLTAWSEPFGGKIRYCLYNGDTQYEAKASKWKSEVADRRRLRNEPPPILVTNATMLEYMLVRSDDRPILEQSQGKLRWIVIDEAHTYIGSQAAELTLLLRRVLHGFGCRPEDVHFVATSATIAAGADGSEQLREFLADIAGVSVDQVSVVQGERAVPALPDVAPEELQRVGADTLRPLTVQDRFDRLSKDPVMRKLRLRLAVQPQTLSAISAMIFGKSSNNALARTLELLDLASKAQQGESFLPLRGHFFQRTIAGLWACANPNCSGRTDTELETGEWPFGKVFIERRKNCDGCGFPVYELMQCRQCGSEHLAVLESSLKGAVRLRQDIVEVDEDEFQQELDPVDLEEHEESDTIAAGSGLRRILVAPPDGNRVGLLPDGRLDWDCDQDERVDVHLLGPGEGNVLACPFCGKTDRRLRMSVPIRLGAPFFLQTAIPMLLRHLPPKQVKAPLPFDGRRILSFTDSRQGTARIAAKLQMAAERDYVRSLLYHAVAEKVPVADQKAIEDKRTQIAALEPLATTNSDLQSVLQGLKQELQKLEKPPAGRLTWNDARDMLLTKDDFKRWLLPALREQSLGMGDRELAELCLWREFFRRPYRQWSLESYGMLAIDYQGISTGTGLPDVAKRLRIQDDEWRDLVRLFLDFAVRYRTAVLITEDILRWIGYPGRPSILLQPGRDKLSFIQQHWPSTASPGRRRSRLVRLLAHAFTVDLDDPEQRDLVEELLVALWQSVRPVLQGTEGGFQLNMREQAVITQVRQGWFCPVTRRVLPVTFRKITPYLPEESAQELAECAPITMPTLPDPFWNTSPEQAEDWLEKDALVTQLRSRGIWTDVNDRVARFSKYFRSAEHSAQLSGSQLTDRERDFKKGKINLLSCSTTMEMGVDIGGLSGVAMHNAPPNPANYLQRAGRAGRRGEAGSLAFTLCKSTPHGEAVFANPLWPFTTRLAVPAVSLHSPAIVQRHINAMLLAVFLNEKAPGELHRLNTGWFFEEPETGDSAPWHHFIAWCGQDALSVLTLVEGVAMLLRRSCLEGRSAHDILGRSKEMLGRCATVWLNEVEALKKNLDDVRTPAGDSVAEKALEFQLQRLRREYLLSELTTRGFLPGYGFPGEVVSLITTTAEELSFKKKHLENEAREDNRMVRAGYPARDLTIAIRDYAPGTDTVLNGRVYRSEGVTLNWHIPADQEGPPELQSFRWFWRCESCGAIGDSPVKPEICTTCGQDDSHALKAYEYLKPSGFAVDIRWRPHNRIDTPQYIPVRDPLIAMQEAEWVYLPTVKLGRCRVSRQAMIIHRSDGLHDSGYALCLRCGRADSMRSKDELPFIFVDEKGEPRPHRRLRGGRTGEYGETECPGSHEPWAIKRNIRLGVTRRTEVLELQLYSVQGVPADRETAYTVGVALRRALAEKIGIEELEIGVTVSPVRDAHDNPIFSVYLFDTAQGGAGYVSQSVEFLPELFAKTREILTCPRDCDSACQACLLSFDTQYHIDQLDRHLALALIDEQFLALLSLPESLQAFGRETRLEMDPLAMAVRREYQRIAAREVRVFLGGSPENWEPIDWRLRDELFFLKQERVKIHLVVPEAVLDALESSQFDELIALTTMLGMHTISCPPSLPVLMQGSAKMYRAVEMGSEKKSVCWAASDDFLLVPERNWGAGSAEGQFVRWRKNIPLESVPSSWPLRKIAELRKVDQDTRTIEIGQELDGQLADFGTKAWNLLIAKEEGLQKKLAGREPVSLLEYTDRYLCSPLMLLLLHNLLKGLQGFPGGIGTTTQVSISTTALQPDGTKTPFLLFHDWQSNPMRRQVYGQLFSWCPDFSLNDHYTRRDLLHTRMLTLRWPNGTGYEIRLDQGIGYWQTERRVPFPFDQLAEHQAAFLNRKRVAVKAMSRDHHTSWYVRQTGMN
ncbi:MAG TPA: DEAD/DEAH box helicase [Desulfobulbus sp.]|nr:DEAD/DEAH box helicase [Desulfobulbus sp.]